MLFSGFSREKDGNQSNVSFPMREEIDNEMQRI